ncbi:MAG: radical SAM family heme chaperone HemW [Betaproteobacteria bacterium]|nr:radical SAM family heme chaperone HemW [Betaproteobacteria bacterium]
MHRAMPDSVTQVSPPAQGIRLTSLPPLALYVHLPWCMRKCPYCDFNSHELRAAVPEGDYVAALLADLETALPSVWGRRVHAIFFGGGTPSLFSARAIDALLAGVRARLNVDPDAEITLEANPGTFEADKFRDFAAAGVNRLSVGIQSFNPKHLAALGRIHDAREAHRAVEIAQTHFANFNLDLMYALPEQTVEEATSDITAAVATGAPHLSFYHLTLEPNTLFFRHPPRLPDEETQADIHERVVQRLVEAGYMHYETSAYARSARECWHNLNYWRFGDYLGIGAGAHAKISFADRIVREVRTRTPVEYMRRVGQGEQIVERREIERGELPFEFMMNALRLTDGIPVATFTGRTGLPVSAVQAQLAVAEAKGLIERDHQLIRPTALGQRFLNDLLQLFLPGPASARTDGEVSR